MQIVFQREIEAGRSRIALPARAATQLVIDAAAFMPLRTDNMEATQRDDLFLIVLALRLDLFEDRFPAILREGLITIENLLEQEVRIAAEENVGAATRHVGRDRHGALLTGLRDDFRFLLMIFGIEHIVFHAVTLEVAGEPFGFFDRNRADQHRLSALVALLDLFDDRVELFLLGSIDDIRIIFADHRAVRSE